MIDGLMRIAEENRLPALVFRWLSSRELFGSSLALHINSWLMAIEKYKPLQEEICGASLHHVRTMLAYVGITRSGHWAFSN